MFCSRNKGADKTVRCAGSSSHVTKSGYINLIKRIPRCPEHLKGFTDFKFKATAYTFIYIPSMCLWAVKALEIFRGCAGSSEPLLLT